MSSAADKANLARIRDNQRRSRARRKEYLQELETRLRQCEFQGIEASAEIQIAARSVADENRKLRALLNEYGVPSNVIEATLQSDAVLNQSMMGSNAGNAVQVLEQLLATKRKCSNDTIYSPCTVGGQNHRGDSRASSVATVPSLWADNGNDRRISEGFSLTGLNQQHNSSQFCTPRTSLSRTPPVSVTHVPNGLARPLSPQKMVRALDTIESSTSNSPTQSQESLSATDIYDTNTQTFQRQSHTAQSNHSYRSSQIQLEQAHLRPLNGYVPVGTLNTNSCLYATDIIANMGSADTDGIRQELGCGSGRGLDCEVDNQLIFSTMDRYSGMSM